MAAVADSPKPSNNPPDPEGTTTRKSGPNTKVVVGILLVILAVAAYLYPKWVFGQSHVSTDDAQVASDVIPITPQVKGTITSVPVKENQMVEAGTVLATIDSANYEIAVADATANLRLAEAQLQSAQASTRLVTQTANASVQQAGGIVGQASAGILASQLEAMRLKSAIESARANARSSQAVASAATSAIQMAKANLQRSIENENAAQAAVETAIAAVTAAEAQLEASRASFARASREAERLRTLSQEGAISGQAYDNAETAAASASAAVDAAKAGVRQATTALVQRRSELLGAKTQIVSARAAIGQAQSQRNANLGQAEAATSAVRQSISLQQEQEAQVRASRAHADQASGLLSQAQTGPSQILVSQAAESQAKARVEQAKAALAKARLDLSRTQIRAPVSGRITRKTIQVGQLVDTTGLVMNIVKDSAPWVVANFKETQLERVRVGQPVDVESDAFPGKIFHGKVDGISAGTGATFALLPPDNATGNFTKVVQRVPIKIVLDSTEDARRLLRSGLSVVATIEVK